MKKKLLFAAYSLDLGGIEKALVNLLNRIDYKKYDVTLVLEKKEGIFLKEVNSNVEILELKVSNSKNIIFRKLINFIRKYKFKKNYQNKFDFSCCYATYSYSSAKLALIASENNSLYIHSNYTNIYNDKDFYKFFNSRNIDKFKRLIFVSNEAKKDFVKKYNEYKDKSIVINNFIDVEDIKKKSSEKIEIGKKFKKLFVFVGRLDESSKKITRQIKLIKNLEDTELWIIGDGKDREKLEREVFKNYLEDRITFLGSRENPYPYIKKSDYVILTSDYEGFPVIYLEAITLGKKIITTINTSDDQIKIDDYAYIVSKGENKMLEEVKEIIKSRKKVEEINLEKIQKDRMKQLEKIFNEVV